MKLRLTSDPADGFKHGSSAQLELDGVDVSRYVSKVTITADASGPISAEVTLFLTGLEVDLPAEVNALLDTRDEAGVMAGHVKRRG